MEEDEDSEDDRRARLFDEFGLGDLPADTSQGDNDEAPDWTGDDIAGW